MSKEYKAEEIEIVKKILDVDHEKAISLLDAGINVNFLKNSYSDKIENELYNMVDKLKNKFETED